MADDLRNDLDGYDVITTALMTLVNQYPALQQGDVIRFSELKATGGIGFFPQANSVITEEHKDIFGGTVQKCAYQFYVIYRVGGLKEAQKKTKKEWLDDLGRWLEKQTIKVGSTSYTLASYPALTGNRKFLSIKRLSAASIIEQDDNNVEDWGISIQALYRNEF